MTSCIIPSADIEGGSNAPKADTKETSLVENVDTSKNRKPVSNTLCLLSLTDPNDIAKLVLLDFFFCDSFSTKLGCKDCGCLEEITFCLHAVNSFKVIQSLLLLLFFNLPVKRILCGVGLEHIWLDD